MEIKPKRSLKFYQLYFHPPITKIIKRVEIYVKKPSFPTESQALSLSTHNLITHEAIYKDLADKVIKRASSYIVKLTPLFRYNRIVFCSRNVSTSAVSPK